MSCFVFLAKQEGEAVPAALPLKKKKKTSHSVNHYSTAGQTKRSTPTVSLWSINLSDANHLRRKIGRFIIII